MPMTVNLDLTGVAKQFEDGITNACKAVANSVLTELVVRTPIDTGKAKSNWQVDLNQEASGVKAASAPGTHGSTYNANNSYTIYNGNQVIDTAKLGDTINITNNLDYIEELNNGTSQQAPAGFVEDAVVIGITAVNNVRIIP